MKVGPLITYPKKEGIIIKHVIEAIYQYKVIAIMRNVSINNVLESAQALYDGGIRLLEVTFNQKSTDGGEGTAEVIRILTRHFGDKMCIGAGTVMSVEQVKLAVDAGGKFMISPNTDSRVIKYTKQLNVVSIPGAFTPTEIIFAYESGADFVKLFPAGELGIGYIKAIRAPLNHIPLLAVGGVDEMNLLTFLDAGLAGVGIGSNIVSNQLIAEGRFSELTELAKKFTQQIRR